MIVICTRCNMPYDDAVSSVNCPHKEKATYGPVLSAIGGPTIIKGIENHAGNKYVRRILPCHLDDGAEVGMEVDIYCVLKAFAVTCPARAHAIKKLLCAGLRGKGSQVKDLTEAIDALYRAVEMQKQSESGGTE